MTALRSQCGEKPKLAREGGGERPAPAVPATPDQVGASSVGERFTLDFAASADAMCERTKAPEDSQNQGHRHMALVQLSQPSPAIKLLNPS